jgi:hypothetical protein
MGTSKVEGMVDRGRVEVEDQAARADAFRALADRHLDASYRLAQAILGQRAEAEGQSLQEPGLKTISPMMTAKLTSSSRETRNIWPINARAATDEGPSASKSAATRFARGPR